MSASMAFGAAGSAVVHMRYHMPQNEPNFPWFYVAVGVFVALVLLLKFACTVLRTIFGGTEIAILSAILCLASIVVLMGYRDVIYRTAFYRR